MVPLITAHIIELLVHSIPRAVITVILKIYFWELVEQALKASPRSIDSWEGLGGNAIESARRYLARWLETGRDTQLRRRPRGAVLSAGLGAFAA